MTEFRVVVRTANGELQVSGSSINDIKRELQEIQQDEELIEEIKGFSAKVQAGMPSEPKTVVASTSRHPTRGSTSSEIAKPKGTTDAILKILATEWGRAKLRTWKETRDELERVGYQFSAGAISGAFTNLFKEGKLRRQKTGDAYCYGLPLESE